MDDRPTQSQVFEMLQQALADAHGAASATATATSKAAVQPLLSQLDDVAADLQAAKLQLQAAQQELDGLKDWQVRGAGGQCGGQLSASEEPLASHREAHRGYCREKELVRIKRVVAGTYPFYAASPAI